MASSSYLIPQGIKNFVSSAVNRGVDATLVAGTFASGILTVDFGEELAEKVSGLNLELVNPEMMGTKLVEILDSVGGDNPVADVAVFGLSFLAAGYATRRCITTIVHRFCPIVPKSKGV